MNFFNKYKKTIYISLFALLYLIVALVSTLHAISFMSLANVAWMAIILAFAFEVGQASVLFSLLTSPKDRSKVMPWVLMTIFTIVQILGNVYSSYKYIITNSVENLRYFKEPVFIWTSLPDDQATVIITYTLGAILPVSALLLTAMVTNYLNDEEDHIKENNIINDNIIKDEQDIRPQSERDIKDESQTEMENEKEQGGGTSEGDDVQDVQVNNQENIKEDDNKKIIKSESVEEKTNNDNTNNKESEIDDKSDQQDEEDRVEDNTPYKKSHFIG